MKKYDPSRTPEGVQWLALDEQERLDLVRRYHRRHDRDLPNLAAHTAIHVVVENQIALQDEPVVKALTRLVKQGLSRHDAVHAIGTCVTEQIFDLLREKDTPESSRARYYAAIERITAQAWLNSGENQ